MNSVTIKSFTLQTTFILVLLSLFAVFNYSAIIDRDNNIEGNATKSHRTDKTFTSDRTEPEDPYFVVSQVKDEQTAEICTAQNEPQDLQSEPLTISSSSVKSNRNEKKNRNILKNSSESDSPEHDSFIGCDIPKIFHFRNSTSSCSVPAFNDTMQVEVTESIISANKVPIADLAIADDSPEFPLYETILIAPKADSMPDVSKSTMTENVPVPEPIYAEYVSTTPPQLPPLDAVSGEFESGQEVLPAPAVATHVGFLREISMESNYSVNKEPVPFPEVKEEPVKVPTVQNVEIFGTFPIDEETAMYEIVPPSPHFGVKEPVVLPDPEVASENRQNLSNSNKMMDFPPVE